MIDLEKERKLFQDFLTENYDFENHEQTYFDEKTQCYVNDCGEDTEHLNIAWETYKKCAESKQAEIDSLKAQQKLNKPARIGGTVFREGVAWRTVIECAQRHYDYAQRDTQPTPLISPSDAIKLASGELVLVPKDPTEAMIKHAYGTYEGATILPYSFYKAMIEAAQENGHE